MGEMISPSDMNLFARAAKGLNDAQSNMAFVTGYLVETYKLGPQDSVNPQTGEIHRVSQDEA